MIIIENLEKTLEQIRAYENSVREKNNRCNKEDDFADDGSKLVPSITVSLGGNEWRVLDVQDGKSLLLSEKVIEKRAFHRGGGDMTWETCTLREYLNGEFYNRFDATEKAMIAETMIAETILVQGYYDYLRCAIGAEKTTDKIFLLSLREVVTYLGKFREHIRDSSRSLHLGDKRWVDDEYYDSARIAKDESGAASWWWLRSPSGNSVLSYVVASNITTYVEYHNVAYVDDKGTVYVEGGRVNDESGGVRPALWLNL